MKRISLFGLILIFASQFLYSADVNFGFDAKGNKYVRGMLKVKLSEDASIRSFTMSPNSALNDFTGIASIDNKLRSFGAYKSERSFGRIQPNYKLINADNSEEVNEFAKVLERYITVYFDEFADHSRVIAALMNDEHIEIAEPVWVYEAFSIPNDPSYGEMFQFAQIQAEQAWAVHKGEKGVKEVVIGIHDSGVEWFHPDLLPNLWINEAEWTNRNEPLFITQGNRLIINPAAIDGEDSDGNGYIDDVIGFNFFTDDGTPANDPNGSTANRHGTHVASIAAGATNNGEGVASISWNVKFVGTKHSHNSSGQYLYNVDQGLIYMGAIGVDVINMSWGGSGFSYVLLDIFNYLNSLGITLIAAAGNGNNDNFFLPASYPHVISVASITSQDRKTYYSTFGHAVDVSAPGGDVTVDGGILAAVPFKTYARFQGTSMASPLVAGLAGLIKSYRPNLSPKEIAQRICGAADPIYALNPAYMDKLGEGRINAYRSLTERDFTFRKPLRLYPMDKQILDENGNGLVEPGETITIRTLMVNFNKFSGAENVIFRLKSDDPDIIVYPDSWEGYMLVGDDQIMLQSRMRAEVKATAKPKIARLYIQIETSAEMLNPDIVEIEVIIAGGVLVYHPRAVSNFQSGEYFKQYLESNNYDVVYTNKAPTDFNGFKAVFISYGHYSETPVYSVPQSEAISIYYYLEAGGRAYIEASSHFSQQFFGSLGFGPYMGYLFGLQQAQYSSGANPINQFRGINGTFAQGLTFFNTSQPLTTQTDRFVPNSSMGGFALFENVGWGNTMVACNGLAGHKTVVSSYSLGKLVDVSCPSKRDVVMAKILDFFGLTPPIVVEMPDLVTCQGTPVVLGENYGTDCMSGTFKNLAVRGGSGNFLYSWHPSTGLSNPNVLTPTVLNPINSITYTLTVTDILSGAKGSGKMHLAVMKSPEVNIPITRTVPRNTYFNLYSLITNYNPDITYMWYTDKGVLLTYAQASNWFATSGMFRFDLIGVSADGCSSAPKRITVIVPFRKETVEEYIVGDNGQVALATYPNPVSDFLNITAQFTGETASTLKIMSLTGELLLTLNFAPANSLNEQINLANFSAGTYLIVLENAYDKVSSKIIKN